MIISHFALLKLFKDRTIISTPRSLKSLSLSLDFAFVSVQAQVDRVDSDCSANDPVMFFYLQKVA